MTYSEGKTYHGFTLEKQSFIEELHSHIYVFRHQLLECPLLAIKNDDGNKTFTVAFNTIPQDSTGVAHILEHSVLMGSQRYPIKDVFGEINKGGLTTFLNAMTGSDITYYPFATRNLKEYFNVMDVYCDVVFNPLLERSTFEQEGWHYHLESKDGELQFQGVVFNEMKGAFSDPIRLIFYNIFNGLLPGSTYAHESGGDPKDIPSLTYEQFCNFHRQHYHPSNATFFCYGDADLDEELRFLQTRFLDVYQSKGERCSVVPGTLQQTKTFIEDNYAVESSQISDKTFLAVGTTVGTAENREENAAFQIIANILYNSDGSPLKDAIVKSGLCKDFGGFYLSSSCLRTFMITYLVGSEKEHRDTFLTLYNDTLKEMVRNGLDRELMISELNKFEFAAREEASKSQRGLDLIGKALTAFKYGTSPFESLVNEELIKTVRRKALEEGYFEDLIQRHLLGNDSTVIVTLKPDPDKGRRTLEEERQRLAEYRKNLDEQQTSELIARTQELMQLQLSQNDEETLDKLPRLQLSDLPADIDFHQVTQEEMFGRKILVNELPTNRISYLDVGFNFQTLPVHLLPWLDIFGTIITEIGTEKMNYMQFAKEVASSTGSFTHSITTYLRHGSPDMVTPMFWLHTKCLPDYLERTIELLRSVLAELSIKDTRRIREIIGREFAWAEHTAQSEGYSLPMTRIFAHLSDAGRYNELINGITSYRKLKELALNYDSQEQAFLSDLQQIAEHLFIRDNLHLCISGEEGEIERFRQNAGCIPEALPKRQAERIILPDLGLPRHEAFITSAEVVFAVEGGTILPGGQGYNGHFEVLRTFLSRDYLWNTVRQMGGAYGCFIQFSHISGNIAFISYRDPQVRKTYEAYRKIPQVIEEIRLPDKMLQQLIIGTYGNFDPHHSPYMKAATARNEYFTGITSAHKQTRLEEITRTTVADLQAFAPAFSSLIENSFRASIGNRAKLEADRDLFSELSEL